MLSLWIANVPRFFSQTPPSSQQSSLLYLSIWCCLPKCRTSHFSLSKLILFGSFLPAIKSHLESLLEMCIFWCHGFIYSFDFDTVPSGIWPLMGGVGRLPVPPPYQSGQLPEEAGQGQLGSCPHWSTDPDKPSKWTGWARGWEMGLHVTILHMDMHKAWSAQLKYVFLPTLQLEMN